MERQDDSRAEEKIEEIDLGTRLSRNPVLWFGLLLIPIFFGLLVGFAAPREEIVQLPAVQVENQAAPQASARAAQAEAPKLSNGRMIAGQAVPDCVFDIWVGRPLNEAAIVQEMNRLGRPYRFLPPGSMMTMDHSPARVNFDLDERGVVRRIWCG